MKRSFFSRLGFPSRVCILFSFILPFSSLLSQDPSFDFIYVDANTGQSSGGHSAVRMEDTVFHFQFYPDGIFRIVKESYDRFSYSYNIYSNRTSKIAKIQMSEAELEKIRDGFEKVSVIQFKHLKNLESIRRDLSFLKEISEPNKSIRIKSLGYFQEGNRSDILLKLREELDRKKGKGWLGKIRSELKSELSNSVLEKKFEISSLLPKVEVGTYPFYKGGISSWFIPKLEKLSVLEILDGEFRLNQDTVFSSASYPLSPEEKLKLTVLKDSIFASVVDLLEEDAPDWGHPAIVNLARLLVLEKSIESGKLHYLISFPDTSDSISPEVFKEHKEFVKQSQKVLLEAAKNFRDDIFKNESISEEDYQILEDLENRDWELRTGMQRGISIRNTFEKLSPDLSGTFLYSFPIPEKENIDLLISQAEKKEGEYYDTLKLFYNFKLVSRNCTSEIFDVLNFSLNEKEYRESLGERINPHRSFSFIPFVAYDTILTNWHVKHLETEFSYRKSELKKMYSTNSDMWYVYFRESNTLTSSVYRSNEDDPSFLFFTDDLFLLRPIYGVANLGWGLGNSILGIFTLPFDKGKRIQNGLQSAFFSLPELVFFNIRKGSFPNAPSRKAQKDLKTDQ
ncbi:hypothetical protein EHO59_08125 [Leptospira semungkisensis]|uniref:DUF4105 domain-containing protein n=1 Tax=Leptospira semungkisensis TaxID=2484985 RepID=A0A4R9G0P5_9LEPT|nr:hypothetical protein [Leptospira semungkisensis]TGK04814.1 hypothetical protein EHO59_08125 [Leptospira semungkisensis]